MVAPALAGAFGFARGAAERQLVGAFGHGRRRSAGGPQRPIAKRKKAPEPAAEIEKRLLAAWNDADALESVIGAAIKCGLSPALEAPARRLAHLRRFDERSTLVLALVLTESGSLEAAEAALAGYAAQYGETGAVATARARVLAARRDFRGAALTLRRALCLDPNNEEALIWWMAIHEARGGAKAVLEALEDIAREPESRRAQEKIAAIKT